MKKTFHKAAAIALTGAKIYRSPEDPPIEDGTVLIRNGLIIAVGPESAVKISEDGRIVNCEGMFLPMPQDIASAAADEAQRNGKLVFAHASNISGLEVSLKARVDVLAHALDDDRGWNETYVKRMISNKMSMIPTLQLFDGYEWTKYVVKEVEDFSRAGGQILFGTDAGYLSDYDPTREYELLSMAGSSWQQILVSLTTAPAERFGESKLRGRIAPGMRADIVVLTADPASDVRAFSKVRYTLREGQIIYGQLP